MSHTTHAKGKSDVVLTPEWAVKDMLDFFQPNGTVLDPCRGEGAFHDLLPEGSPWCEITEGRDFFDWDERVDWVIGNPPYSLTRPWFKHSYKVAENLCYLVPCRNIFSGYGFLREIYGYGGFRHIRVYGTGGRLGFPMGNAVAAFHIQRHYRGEAGISFVEEVPHKDEDYLDYWRQTALTFRADTSASAAPSGSRASEGGAS